MSESFRLEDFDTTTTYGALEYIIAYARDVWNCPIYLYSNPYYENDGYAEMVETAERIAEKWSIVYIDLYRDEAFNDISSSDRMLYMKDFIHPLRAGYRLWWTPVFEDVLFAAVD